MSSALKHEPADLKSIKPQQQHSIKIIYLSKSSSNT